MKKSFKYILFVVALIVAIPLSLIIGDYLGYEFVQTDSIEWNNYKIKINNEGFSSKIVGNGDLVILGLKDKFLLEATKRKVSPISLLNLHADQVCKISPCLFKEHDIAKFYNQEVPYLYYAKDNPSYFEANYVIESENVYITITSEFSLDRFDSITNNVISSILNIE